jgi:hypothetical protein
MKQQTQNCQNCKKDFIIEPDDFLFYESFKTSPLLTCQECVLRAVEALRNERTVYWHKCYLCGDKTMSIYNPDSSYTIYCHDCFWSDKWNGSDYKIDYDSSLNFLNQIKLLKNQVPREALIILNSDNCSYGNNIRDSKNCYFSFQVANSENILYSIWIVGSKDCINCHKVIDSEFLSYCVDVFSSYRSFYLQDSSNCMDCYLGYDLKNCSDCFMCFNLRNKTHCILNKQYTKEEYDKELQNLLNGSYEHLNKLIDEWKIVSKNAIHKFAFLTKTNDVTGNYIQGGEKNYNSFDSINNYLMKDSVSILNSKNTYLSYAIGTQPTEYIYSSCVIKGGSMIKNSFNLFNCNECEWCDSLISCSNCIGCVGIKNKSYCILNKQYTKEEYLEIYKKLKDKGELDTPMNSSFCTFAYNETVAQDHFPLSKEEALRLGYRWADSFEITKGKETLKTEEIKDNIVNVDESILQEIFACLDCSRNFKINTDELRLLKRLKLFIPRDCPYCRINKIRKMRLPFKLWHRSCMKEGCKNEFKTSYSPDRPEIVYCEKCYQQEVY